MTLWLTSRYTDRWLEARIVRRWGPGLRATREGLRDLIVPKVVFVGVALGTLAWVSQGAALWLIMKGLGTEISRTR